MELLHISLGNRTTEYSKITIYQGSDFRQQFQIRSSNGACRNLSSQTILANLAPSISSQSNVRTIFLTSHDDNATGKFSISLNNTQTSSLTGNYRYFYTIKIKNNSNNATRRAAEGTIYIDPDV